MQDDHEKVPNEGAGVSRRTFIGTTGFIAATAIVTRAAPLPTTRPWPYPSSAELETDMIVLRVNGHDRQILPDSRTTVLDALREQIGLTGTKKGCDHGQCGACTVHLDGERALSCLLLAVAVQGRDIQTIEGISGEGGGLHPMQQAFIDHDAFQCGYCTPGQIMSAIACVEEGHANSRVAIQEFMSGNLCRCAAYPNIVAAIGQARQEMHR